MEERAGDLEARRLETHEASELFALAVAAGRDRGVPDIGKFIATKNTRSHT